MHEQHGAVLDAAIQHLAVPSREPRQAVEVNIVAQVVAWVVGLLGRHERRRVGRFAEPALPSDEDFVVFQRRG